VESPPAVGDQPGIEGGLSRGRAAGERAGRQNERGAPLRARAARAPPGPGVAQGPPAPVLFSIASSSAWAVAACSLSPAISITFWQSARASSNFCWAK